MSTTKKETDGFECVNHLPDCSTVPKGRQGECIRCYMRRYMKGYKLKQKAKQAQAANHMLQYYAVPASGMHAQHVPSTQYLFPMLQQTGYAEMPQVYSAGLLSAPYGSYPLHAGGPIMTQPLQQTAPASNVNDTTHLPSIFNGEYSGPLPYSCPEIRGFWINEPAASTASATPTTPTTPTAQNTSQMSTASLVQNMMQSSSNSLPTMSATPLMSTAPPALQALTQQTSSALSSTVHTSGTTKRSELASTPQSTTSKTSQPSISSIDFILN